MHKKKRALKKRHFGWVFFDNCHISTTLFFFSLGSTEPTGTPTDNPTNEPTRTPSGEPTRDPAEPSTTSPAPLPTDIQPNCLFV